MKFSCFWAFLMGPVASGRGLSIVYNSELFNHVSNNWEVVAGQNYTDYKL